MARLAIVFMFTFLVTGCLDKKVEEGSITMPSTPIVDTPPELVEDPPQETNSCLDMQEGDEPAIINEQCCRELANWDGERYIALISYTEQWGDPVEQTHFVEFFPNSYIAGGRIKINIFAGGGNILNNEPWALLNQSQKCDFYVENNRAVEVYWRGIKIK